MPTTFPDVHPANQTDFTTLRWCVRADGNSGYVFVNNYQRLQPLPAKKDVQFKLDLPGGELVFPARPVTIPADEFFIWPFNLDLGGAKLIYATAQPICKIDDGNVRTFFFAETPGVKAEFHFDPQTLAGRASSRGVFENVKPGDKPAIRLQTQFGGEIQIVLLDEADSLALRKDAVGWAVFEKNQKPSAISVKTELIQPAGPLREIPFSTGKSPIAIAPTDADFTNAAVWKIKLPAKLDLSLNPILRIRYLGDVARLTLNGKLIDDNFYSGRDFDLGLNRYAPKILTGDLRLEILPLRKNAPIFLEPKARPDFGANDSLAKLQSTEIIYRRQAEFIPAIR
jgi:hypothetical protein